MGVDWRKVRFTEIPFPQMNDPLLNGQVDAVTQVDPFRSVMMATGKVEILGWTYVEAAPGTDVSQYITLAPWAEKNHDTAVKFVRAVLKGVQFASTNEAATRDINQAWTGLNPAFKDKVLLPQLGTAVERCGHGANHAADAEIRLAQAADRHLKTRLRNALTCAWRTPRGPF